MAKVDHKAFSVWWCWQGLGHNYITLLYKNVYAYIRPYFLIQKVKNSSVVDRLTDTSKYTGSHKERFDDSGKGKGLDGRDSNAKGAGMAAGSVAGQASYVTGYKHEGTYDKKH